MDRNNLFLYTDITDDDIDRMVEEFRTHPEEEDARPVIAPFEEELSAIVNRAQAPAPTFADAFAKLDSVEDTAEDASVPTPIIAPIPPVSEGRTAETPCAASEDTPACETAEEPSSPRKKKRRRKKAVVPDTPPVSQDVSEEDALFTDDTAQEEDAPAPVEDPAPSDPETATPVKKRGGFMRFLGELVPHVGDSVFDIIRKTVMLLAVVVFIGAGTYLLDDLVIVPVQNEILVNSLQGMYDPNNTAPLTPEEENYTYPEGMDPSFKKLYYQNNDVRGWISFHSTDNSTIVCDYPIVQSTDNDYYLHRDYYGSYNKNGTLFYDYRNVIAPDAANKNTIIYGHNMLSGQMFAGLNRLNLGLNYARTAPSFTVNTLYQKSTYKVFAVMAIDASPSQGPIFDYLRTDFADNVDFASFLSEILARSLYVYGGVDVTPDDEIVTLSTCGEEHYMHFKDSRTVVIARKLREGEDPATDVSQIVPNDDVIMPLAWYYRQKQPLHPYYTDINYVIQPIDGILDYMATSTRDPNATTPPTEFTLHYQDGTFGLLVSRTTTFAPYTGTTQAQPQSMRFLRGRTTYKVGEAFDAAGTKLRVTFTDGSQMDVTAAQCNVNGFSSERPGTCSVSFRYGFARTALVFKIEANTVETAAPTTTKQPPTVTTTTTTLPTEPPTEAPTQPTEPPVEEGEPAQIMQTEE